MPVPLIRTPKFIPTPNLPLQCVHIWMAQKFTTRNSQLHQITMYKTKLKKGRRYMIKILVYDEDAYGSTPFEAKNVKRQYSCRVERNCKQTTVFTSGLYPSGKHTVWQRTIREGLDSSSESSQPKAFSTSFRCALHELIKFFKIVFFSTMNQPSFLTEMSRCYNNRSEGSVRDE